ncbi:MAG: LCP family protein [Clostridiales Family XIII bacterium]|jgi:LCP family protein required for cell wall assembly|nr:LCP family protein [Clostridiales Family XIII bacterium]
MAYKERQPKRGSFGKTFFPIFLICLILFTGGLFLLDKFGILSLFGGNLMKDIVPIAGGNSEFSRKYADAKRVNVLLLGTNQGLSDTIMLGSFDTESKRVDVISVPRDTYYEREGFMDDPGFLKINSVLETEGETAIAQAVSDVLGGVPIHFYEIISDDGVARIVDAMGGVEIDVPMDMYYVDEAQGLVIDIAAGNQVLDGAHSVQYLRFRSGYATGDLGRVDAQQAFLKEAFKQSIGFGFPKVAKTAITELETNMSMAMAIRLAGKAVGMDSSDIETYVMPGSSGTMYGASYFFVDEEAAPALMDQIYSITPQKE